MFEEVIIIQDEFIKLLNSDDFISYKRYNRFLEKYKDIFQNSKDDYIVFIANEGYKRIEKHNSEIIDKKLLLHKEYFDNMFKDIDSSIMLDEEQRRAILNEEDYTLIIAGAGAGKTTTMAAKVKYLVDICKVDPSKIVVISYTNKATDELEDRIKYEFNIPVDIMTFHSLGMKIVRKIFNQPLVPVAEKEQEEIIIDFVRKILFKDKNLLSSYVEVFNKYTNFSYKMFSQGFIENYRKFETFEEYFNDYKRRKFESNKDDLENIIAYRTESYMKGPMPRTLKNEVVRSRAEAEIANYLFVNGIDYKYEEPYPEKVDEDTRAYLPDFTINSDGIPIYVEYFGLSSFYSEGTLSMKDKKKYEDLRIKKRQFHALRRNNYIELDYKKEDSQKSYIEELEIQLKKHNVKFNRLSNEQIYNQILNNNVEAEFFHFVDFILSLINDVKSNINREKFVDIIKNYIRTLNAETKVKREMIEEARLFIKVYTYYQDRLAKLNKIDFSDMIFYANKYMKGLAERDKILDYEYLIIDEYQDISLDRYRFARNISLLSDAKVTSVGDDWQTIFSFAGSRIDLFLKYDSLFPGAKQLFINNTYRSCQELVDKSSAFIMKNDMQIKKNLVAHKYRENPLKFYLYNDTNQFELVRKVIFNIYKNNPKDKILILARKNKHIKNMFQTRYFTEGLGTRVILDVCPDAMIDAMSVHKAKGLGADQVILLSVTNNDYPCSEAESIWLNAIFKPKGYKEDFPYAEERRVFYVALTRAKKDVHIMIPMDANERSPFVNELISR